MCVKFNALQRSCLRFFDRQKIDLATVNLSSSDGVKSHLILHIVVVSTYVNVVYYQISLRHIDRFGFLPNDSSEYHKIDLYSSFFSCVITLVIQLCVPVSFQFVILHILDKLRGNYKFSTVYAQAHTGPLSIFYQMKFFIDIHMFGRQNGILWISWYIVHQQS